MTKLVHGSRGLQRAQIATRVLYGESLSELRGADLVDAFHHDPRLVVLASQELDGMSMVELLKHSGACPSKSMLMGFVVV